MNDLVVIFDIDGTLALRNGRGVYEFEKADSDTVNFKVAHLLYMLYRNGVKPIFVTGRTDNYRTITEEWIKSKIFDADEVCWFEELTLFMRNYGDPRSDYVVKEEIYNKYIKNNYRVWLVVDDRDSVVGMWRKLGLECWQVAEGDF